MTRPATSITTWYTWRRKKAAERGQVKQGHGRVRRLAGLQQRRQGPVAVFAGPGGIGIRVTESEIDAIEQIEMDEIWLLAKGPKRQVLTWLVVVVSLALLFAVGLSCTQPERTPNLTPVPGPSPTVSPTKTPTVTPVPAHEAASVLTSTTTPDDTPMPTATAIPVPTATLARPTPTQVSSHRQQLPPRC